MIIPQSIAHIIIGDKPSRDNDRHLIDMPRQNPVFDREIREGEHAEMTFPDLAQLLMTETTEDKKPSRRLFTIA